MSAHVRSVESLLPWLAVQVPLLAVGVDGYCLTPDKSAGHVEEAGDRSAPPNKEGQDLNWTVLAEELNHKCQWLAASHKD